MTDYLTLDEYKALAKTEDVLNTEDDARIQSFITHASRLVDTFTSRPEGAYQVAVQASTSDRYYEDAAGDEVKIDEAVAVTAVATSTDGGSTFTSLTVDTDYWTSDGLHYGQAPTRLLIANPNGTQLVWPRGRRAVKVTGRWGYATAAPAPIQQAVYRLARLMYHQKPSNDDDRTVITAQGIYLPASAIPRDVQVMLAPFKRMI